MPAAPLKKPPTDCAAAACCRPFLKWVGGKTQLLAAIRARCPARFNRYFEPFLGGGAVFFSLAPRRAVISDLNPELVNAYVVVRDEVEELIRELSSHVYEAEYFYRMRAADRGEKFGEWSALKRASRLIYLNKTCYNGLYRVNAKGFFNTPIGRYANPRIVDAENLRACSAALAGTEIAVGGFEQAAKRAKRGDFVYFDPPYVPLSATSSFTSYSREGFGLEQQAALARLCKRLDEKGVLFLLSNSASAASRELYRGFEIEEVRASRAINSNAAKRGEIAEILVRNF